MKQGIFAFFVVLATIVGCSGEKDDSAKTKVSEKSSEKNRIAYSLGVQYAKGLSDLSFDKTDQEFFLRGMRDHFNQEIQIDNNDIQVFAKKSDDIRQENRKMTASSEREKGSKFVEQLTQNSPEYRTHPSGLIYNVIKMGEVVQNPKEKSFIGMNYESAHLNDEVYESTLTGNPRSLPLKGIFKAWQIAFSIVGANGEIEIIAPPELTYGNTGALPYVAPGEYLKFTIKFGDYFDSNPKDN